MAGKTTLLRSVGANAVLAMAGAPVTASKLRVSPFKICASISVADSLLEGKSKFLAEVERLRDAIVSTEETRPVLFLIDEILSGTNSRDRRAAAETVIRTLVDRGALGALSTHDLALTEIADSVGGGANVHMSSRRGTDVLDFDYLLKPGVTREANATAIARLAGVPV
jgi:DNA mismatch repair ATPase MutS